MKKYQIQNSIGSGNFSTVFKGVLIPDLTPCAIKILKTHHNIALREAQLLKKFKHPNIISIIDFEQTQNQSRLILQYMGINTLELYQSYSQSHTLREEQVKCILFQAALGLHCVHSHRIIHRDVKPENILIDKKLAIVKLIDFGLAIENYQVSTDYIATRWYRAPENLLGTKEYTCAIDVFSLGCVIVQLYLGAPLFPGKDNIDQIQKIFSVLGFPSPQIWPKGFEKMVELGIKVNQSQPITSLRSIILNCDPRLLEILEKMLQINPKNRITCEDIVKHSYFRDVKSIVPPAVFRRFQEDIMMAKPINFKGFQPAKSSKNNSNEFVMRQQQKINFHHVSARTRQQEPARPAIIQKSPIYRQQKSSSVDSYQNMAHRLLPNFSQIKVMPNGFQNLNRKLSIPSLSSYNTIAEPISMRQSRLKENFQNKNYVEMIPEDNEPQMTISTRIPDGSEPPTSQLSRNFQINMDFSNKFERISNQGQFDNKPYPSVMNVPMVPEPMSYGPSNLSSKLISPQSSFRQHRDETINSVKYAQEQPRSPMHISLKPFVVESYRPPLETSQNSNFQSFKSFDNSQSLMDKSLGKDQSKKLRNFPQMRGNIPQFVHRQNSTSPAHNPSRIEPIMQKPEITYRNSLNQINGKQVFFSPAHRMPISVSPDNFNMGRQRRIQAVNSPVQHFHSHQLRKY